MTSLSMVLVVLALGFFYAWADERQRRSDIERNALATETGLKESLAEACDRADNAEYDRQRFASDAWEAEQHVEELEAELTLLRAVAAAALPVVSVANTPLDSLRSAYDKWDEYRHPSEPEQFDGAYKDPEDSPW